MARSKSIAGRSLSWKVSHFTSPVSWCRCHTHQSCTKIRDDDEITSLGKASRSQADQMFTEYLSRIRRNKLFVVGQNDVGACSRASPGISLVLDWMLPRHLICQGCQTLVKHFISAIRFISGWHQRRSLHFRPSQKLPRWIPMTNIKYSNTFNVVKHECSNSKSLQSCTLCPSRVWWVCWTTKVATTTYMYKLTNPTFS